MPNQKGSLKDRFRSWTLFLKYRISLWKKNRELKKKQKKREQELKKQQQLLASGKYYSKPKVIGLTIIGLFLGIFESKKSKEDQIARIEVKVKNLECDLEENGKSINIDAIDSIKKELTNIKIKNSLNKNIQIRIAECEKKVSNIESKQQLLSHKHISTNIDSSKKVDKYKTNYTNDNIKVKSKKGVYTPVLEIKVFNKEMKDYQKELNQINTKIKTTNDYNRLYELEFALRQLKSRFNDLLLKYNHLKELPGFDNLNNVLDIDTIDIYNLRYDEESLLSSIKLCNSYLNDIEEVKKNLLRKPKEKKQDIKVNVESDKKSKEKENKKTEKRIEKEISEVMIANKIILDKLANEQKNIMKFERSINKLSVKKRKRSIFYYTKNFVSSIMNFGLSLFPLSLFRNKFVGGLVSGIMINNSLKSVKRILNPEVEISYILYSSFEKELNSTQDYLNSINIVCNDSLGQIKAIRDELYLKYGSDLEYSNVLDDYLKDLSNIEMQILNQKTTVINMQQQVSYVKSQNKQKVKKMEWQ